MTYKVLVIHGSFGSPFINWFPWLQAHLQSQEIECLIPTFPIGTDQNYKNWQSVLDAYRPFLAPDLIVIGHSIGPAFLLNYLYDNPDLGVSKFISVSGFYDALTLSREYNEVNSSFFDRPVESLFKNDGFKKIENKIAFYATNDPYLNPQDLTKFADSLKGENIVSETAGHFNSESGYNEFRQILDYLNLV
jgi:hypothetical protein